MKNNTNPIDRIKLMMSYNNEKTLNENLNVLNLISEDESTEVGEQRSAIRKNLNTAAAGAKETAIISAMGKEFKLADNVIATALTKDLTQLTKELEDAIKLDLKNGVRVSTTNTLGPAAKEASKLKAMKEMSLKSNELKASGRNITTKEIDDIVLRAQTESKEMARKLETGVVSKEGKKAANQTKKIADLEAKIKQLETVKTPQQAEAAIKNEVNITMTQGGSAGTQAGAAVTHAEVQAIKEIAPEAKVVAQESKAIVETMKPSKWQKFKAIAGKLSPKYWIMLGLAGVGGWYLWKFFKGGTTKPGDQLFGKCLDDVIDDNGTTIKNTPGGDPVVQVKNTGFPGLDIESGGLWFYNNGRVWMINGTKKGRWSCKGTETVVAEQDGNPNTGIGNINITWDGETAPVTTEPVKTEPVKTDNPNYHDCSSKDFPLEFGCVSPKIAEIQKCLGITPQKGNFGPKTKKGLEDLHYNLSGGITKETYDKIIAACKPAEQPKVDGKPAEQPKVDGKPAESPKVDNPVTTPITPPAVPAEPVFDRNRLQELLASKNLVKKRKGVIVKWVGPELEGNDYYILDKYLIDKGYIQKKQRETGDRDDEDVTMKYKWKLQGEE
jgi:cell fate (sporulation/competence/biofilm development) regulator YmcA (YheA/YmcA/DUF963 family)